MANFFGCSIMLPAEQRELAGLLGKRHRYADWNRIEGTRCIFSFEFPKMAEIFTGHFKKKKKNPNILFLQGLPANAFYSQIRRAVRCLSGTLSFNSVDIVASPAQGRFSVAVVVSALGGVTDELDCHQRSSCPVGLDEAWQAPFWTALYFAPPPDGPPRSPREHRSQGGFWVNLNRICWIELKATCENHLSGKKNCCPDTNDYVPFLWRANVMPDFWPRPWPMAGIDAQA